MERLTLNASNAVMISAELPKFFSINMLPAVINHHRNLLSISLERFRIREQKSKSREGVDKVRI